MQIGPRTESPDSKSGSCARNPLIVPGHRHPFDPEEVVAVSAEEGKGAMPGEVDSGGGAQGGRGGEEEFGGGAVGQVTGAERLENE